MVNLSKITLAINDTLSVFTGTIITNLLGRINSYYINSYLSAKNITHIHDMIEEVGRDEIYDFLLTFATNLVKHTGTPLTDVMNEYYDIYKVFYTDEDIDMTVKKLTSMSKEDFNPISKHTIAMLTYIIRLNTTTTIAYVVNKSKSPHEAD